MEKRTSKAISRTIRGLRKPRTSRIAKHRKTAQGTGVRQGCTVMHPRQDKRSRRIRTHDHPCTRRKALRLYTGGRAASGPAWFCVFRSLYFVFLHFLRDLKFSFSSTLGRNLGFSIVSINPTRERLD